MDAHTLRTAGLTRREREIVRLVAQGKTDCEIAFELFISMRTVHTHVRNSVEKVDTRNRTSLAVIACREGLLGDMVVA